MHDILTETFGLVNMPDTYGIITTNDEYKRHDKADNTPLYPDAVGAGGAGPGARAALLALHLYQQAGGVDQRLVRLQPLLPRAALRARGALGGARPGGLAVSCFHITYLEK